MYSRDFTAVPPGYSGTAIRRNKDEEPQLPPSGMFHPRRPVYEDLPDEKKTDTEKAMTVFDDNNKPRRDDILLAGLILLL